MKTAAPQAVQVEQPQAAVEDAPVKSVCVCVCVCACVCAHVCVYVCVHVCVWCVRCAVVLTSMCLCTYVCARACVCMRVCICVCMYRTKEKTQ